jgi:putative DNA primase/helicase
MSGNGAQLLYLIDEPADTDLVAQVLTALHEKFSTDKVKIDTSVSDAARITRLPGTLNCKGDDVPGRPRRRARIISMPEERKIVSTEQLRMLLELEEPTQTTEVESKSLGGDWTHEKLRDFLDNKYKGSYRVVTDNSKNYDDGIAYDLETCPFIEHGDEPWKSRISLIGGRPGFKCFHNSCSNPKRTFRDFRQLFEPEPPLAIADELRLARHVISTFSRNGVPTLRYFRRDWYSWDGCWKKIEDDEFLGLLYRTCKDYILHNWPPDLFDKNGNPKPAPRLSKTSVGNVALALMSLVALREIGWVDGRGGRWIAFLDQLLDLDAWINDEVVCVLQTPEYFAPTALYYPLSYTDDEPRLLLEKLKDQVSQSEIDALQEFGGYCMTSETAIQRILYMAGPPRSFKGTFERVIRATIGEHNTVSKAFATFLGDHALENMPGKTFLTISDSRPDAKLSRQAVERLLSISGEDPQDINPKGKTQYTEKLICKIGIASNIIADFKDPTGALLSRFLFIETTKSYATNPDPTLLERILAQQNEITWWFLRGLRRLLKSGKYTEPANGLKERFEIQNNPIPSFINSRCVVTGNVKDKLNRDLLFEAFETWCTDNQVNGPEKIPFFRDLYMAYPKIKGHERYVSGIQFLAA